MHFRLLAAAVLLVSTGISLVVATGLPAELTLGTSCFERVSRNSGRCMIGGFRPVRNADQNGDVTHIIHSSLLHLNSLLATDSNIFQLDTDTPQHINAYQQLVNGLRYCVRLRIKNTSCSDDYDPCASDTPRTFVCDVTAYRAFRDQTPRPEDMKLTCHNPK
jgi:hypothetical protein